MSQNLFLLGCSVILATTVFSPTWFHLLRQTISRGWSCYGVRSFQPKTISRVKWTWGEMILNVFKTIWFWYLTRTELTNIIKDGKTFLSNWSEMNISEQSRPKIPICVGRDADGEITNHIIMARNKTEERQLNEGPKSPKKKNSVRYPFYFVEKNNNKKSLEGRFQKKIQKAISGTESTVKTDTGKTINRNFISGPIFQTERRAKKESTINASGILSQRIDIVYGAWTESTDAGTKYSVTF